MLSFIKTVFKKIQDLSEQYAKARLEMAKRNGSFME